jgi:hypothetical protein
MNKIISLLVAAVILVVAAMQEPTPKPNPTMTVCVANTSCVTLPLSYGEGVFKELKDHNCKVKKPYWKDGSIVILALCPPENDA